MNLSIDAIFKFILKNPSTILIGGGILFIFCGLFLIFLSGGIKFLLIFFGWILIIFGVMLNKEWMRSKRR
jgi:uncharacterized membrane protein HdeD (DUF308 family)